MNFIQNSYGKVYSVQGLQGMLILHANTNCIKNRVIDCLVLKNFLLDNFNLFSIRMQQRKPNCLMLNLKSGQMNKAWKMLEYCLLRPKETKERTKQGLLFGNYGHCFERYNKLHFVFTGLWWSGVSRRNVN